MSSELATKEGIFVGITSGATFAGALRVCARRRRAPPSSPCCPIPAERYLSTAAVRPSVPDRNDARKEVGALPFHAGAWRSSHPREGRGQEKAKGRTATVRPFSFQLCRRVRASGKRLGRVNPLGAAWRCHAKGLGPPPSETVHQNGREGASHLLRLTAARLARTRESSSRGLQGGWLICDARTSHQLTGRHAGSAAMRRAQFPTRVVNWSGFYPWRQSRRLWQEAPDSTGGVPRRHTMRCFNNRDR
jgi:hypothetical protein